MSANTIVFHFGLILSPILSGWLLEFIKDYRFMFIWAGGMALAGTAITVSLYRQWLKLGGDKNYSPPGFEEAPAVNVSESAKS